MILPLIFFFFFSSSIIQNTLSLLPLAVSSWYTTLFFHFYCISPLYASSMLPMPYCRCSVSGYFVSLHFDSPNLERRVLYRTISGDLMMDASMGFWNVHNRRPSKLITLLVYYHGMILLSTVYVSLVVQGQKDIYTQPGLGKP